MTHQKGFIIFKTIVEYNLHRLSKKRLAECLNFFAIYFFFFLMDKNHLRQKHELQI